MWFSSRCRSLVQDRRCFVILSRFLGRIASTLCNDAKYCCRCCIVCVCLSVCLSVCHNSEPYKNSWTNRDDIWGVGSDPRGRGIYGVICCFTTRLLFCLLVREFLNWRTFGEVTHKMVDCFMRPIRLVLFCRTRQISRITCLWRTETVTNRCYVNRQIQLTYYQEISNCCRPVLTYWQTYWRHQWLTDCWSCTAFCFDSFFVADVNVFVLGNYDGYIVLLFYCVLLFIMLLMHMFIVLILPASGFRPLPPMFKLNPGAGLIYHNKRVWSDKLLSLGKFEPRYSIRKH